MSSRTKRIKKSSWGARERAGMSFLIVVAFFAVFGLIILTEVLMIDDRGRAGSVVVRHGSNGGRFGESVPDYDDVKDDYLDDTGIFVRETKYGGAVVKNILKNQKDLKQSFGISVLTDSAEPRNPPVVPWGQMLPSKIEQTLPRYPADTKPTDGSWEIVNGTRYKFFVFSAFYDRRDGKLVRVIGATKTRGPEKVWCRFWYQTGVNSTKYRSASVMARVKIIRENWNLKYSACFILCPIRGPYPEIPYAVSVVSKIRAAPGNVLMLRNTDNDPDFTNRTFSNIPNSIGVCVKPLHFNYDQALYLLEFLELNNLLGVSHFTFYNHTIGPKASCVLQHYVSGDLPQHITPYGEEGSPVRPANGTVPDVTLAESNDVHTPTKYNEDNTAQLKPKITVNILPWNLRMRSQKEIRTEGLFASLNDCLYRSMYRYSHVALIDLDEFIIPHHNDTLIDLIAWLSKRINNRNTGAYSFQNAFFYLQFADDTRMYEGHGSLANLRAALTTQRKTRRRSKLHPQKQRSKYICKPEAVIEAGNHFVWEFCPGRGSLNVPADAAILHHYRVCEFGGDDCIKTPSLVDRTAHRYSKRLLDRVGTVYSYLKDTCNLPDIPKAPTKPPPTRKKELKIRVPIRPESEKKPTAEIKAESNGATVLSPVAATTTQAHAAAIEAILKTR
ncbi:AGAP010096-PA-like protein [Anopheles sinensis]|uniref:AGAP010096-PA-like protein n=1 Tax=Anopheles sinensis TaxID=74873 RepID=A0A084VWT1_ANOSI|nr:AGAP010096-PA-like protein [Anopheles sinensis]